MDSERCPRVVPARAGILHTNVFLKGYTGSRPQPNSVLSSSPASTTPER